MPEPRKRITRVEPAGAIGRAASERHYVNVHHAYVRRMYRAHEAPTLRYAANLAVAQHDLTGRFEEEPDAWRWQVSEVCEALSGADSFVPDAVRGLIWEDHLKCIEGIEAGEYEERNLVDRRSGQLSCAKYLFTYRSAAPPGGPAATPAERGRHYDEVHLPALTALAEEAFGLRLFVSNRMVREAATEDGFGPGASIATGYVDAPRTLAIEELYFDNRDWGDEFFGRPEVLALLHHSLLGRVEGYAVTETIGIDER
jgi:hypothetical protein